MNIRILLAGSLVCASSAALADEAQPICAARPGKATPACTVPVGGVQLETGLADWSLQDSGGERDTSLAIGETTLKFGVTDRSDIEIDVTPLQRTTSRGAGFHDSASGFGDITVGYKQQLTGIGAQVQLAVLPFVKIPTAKRPLGNREWEGGMLVPIGYAIPRSQFSIGLTPELDWVADADGRGHHVAMVQVVSVGWQATDKLSLGTELWGQWDWDPAGTGRQASADGTIAYLANPNLQLDAGTNFGLNRETPDVELYAGVSKRF